MVDHHRRRLANINPLTAGVAYMRHPQLYPLPPVSHIEGTSLIGVIMQIDQCSGAYVYNITYL